MRIISMHVQPNGKILVAGTVDSAPIDNYENFGLLRLNADGSVDTGFGTDRVVITQTGDHSDINDLKLLPNGKIIAAGTSLTQNDNLNITTVRYNSDGSLDSTYGTGG